MGNILFKSTPIKQHSAQDQSILALKIERDNIIKYRKRLEMSSFTETKAAKMQLSKSKRERAIQCLQKRKFLDMQIENLDGMLLNIEKIISTLEIANIQQNVIRAIKSGNDMLKLLNESVTLDNVKKLMNESHEAMEFQNELSQLIKNVQLDDDAIMEELEQMEKDEKDIMICDLPSVSKMEFPKTKSNANIAILV